MKKENNCFPFFIQTQIFKCNEETNFNGSDRRDYVNELW